MKFYFDKESLNLDHIPEIKEIRPFQQFKDYYEVEGVEFVYGNDYNEKGIYAVEVSKMTHQWSGKNDFNHNFDLLLNVPLNVLSAIREKKLRLVIISIVEGDPFVKDYWDAFKSLTEKIMQLQLPVNSVLIVSGNVKVNDEYDEWIKKFDYPRLIEFIGGTEGLSSMPHLSTISAEVILKNNPPYIFSSLNRAHRPVRTEHLFWLAEKKFLDKGLVSGGAYFAEYGIQEPLYLDVDINLWNEILNLNYPRSVDINNKDLINSSLGNAINLSIYESSMLSVVTETYFYETGMFITEKTLKPIWAGSLQIILGQPFILDYLKDKFDLDLSFTGIDVSFDKIADNKFRFLAFHESLLEWMMLSNEDRTRILKENFEKLNDNFIKIKKINWKKIIVEDIITSTDRYFNLG
jgi:hypothetical protein